MTGCRLAKSEHLLENGVTKRARASLTEARLLWMDSKTLPRSSPRRSRRHTSRDQCRTPACIPHSRSNSDPRDNLRIPRGVLFRHDHATYGIDWHLIHLPRKSRAWPTFPMISRFKRPRWPPRGGTRMCRVEADAVFVVTAAQVGLTQRSRTASSSTRKSFVSAALTPAPRAHPWGGYWR